MLNDPIYAACQNGVILETYDTREKAQARVDEEIRRDFLLLIATNKLRKLLKKGGNIALHKYSILKIVEVVEVK